MDCPFNPERSAYICDLWFKSDADVLETFYSCLRWINYFQNEDDRYLFLKVYEDIHREVKRRKLKYTWTNKDIKKYRVMGARMYYGALSYKELEWRLGSIILYSIPVYRNIVKDKLYLVRESLEIIIDCIHDLGAWSELEYNKDVIATLDVPFFSWDTIRIIYSVLKTLFLFIENILIFFLFLGETILKTFFNPFWHVVDPEYGSWKNISKGFMVLFWLVSLYLNELCL